MMISVLRNNTSRWVCAVILLLATSLAASACWRTKVTALQRLETALVGGDSEAAIRGCQEYFEKSAGKERDHAVLDSVRHRCAEAFTRWFTELPDELDSATVDRISKMTWIDDSSAKELAK